MQVGILSGRWACEERLASCACPASADGHASVDKAREDEHEDDGDRLVWDRDVAPSAPLPGT